MNSPFFLRWPWLALAAIFLALAAIAQVSVLHIFNDDLTVTRKSDEQQVKLIASIVTAEMDSGRYQNIEQEFSKWAAANDSILSLRLDAANGFNLASYERQAGAKHIFELKLPISYSYHGEATFSARMNLDEVYQRNRILGFQIFAMFVVFGTLLAFLLHMAIQRHHAALRSRRLSKLYKALSEINQAIVRMEQHAELFPLVCRCSVEFGGMNMAFVAQLDETKNSLLPVASYGGGQGYLEGIVISPLADVPEGRGPVGIAYRENRSVIVNDFSTDPITAPWKERAAGNNWQSSAAFPIPRGGQPFAVLSVYHLQSDAFDHEAIALLDEMSRDISFALDNFDRERQRIVGEKSLQLQQKFSDDIINSLPGVFYVIDQHARFVRVNDLFMEITGYSQDEFDQMTALDLFEGEDRILIAQRMQDVFVKGAATAEAALVVKTKQKIPYYFTGKIAIIDELPYLVGLGTDITERMQTLAQLRTTANELERANAQIEEERARLAVRVLERTAQLQYANHAKDSFLATMSHEIRTPLGGLLGMMELLSLSQLGTEQNDILKAAQLSGKSLLRIVNDILDWSKIEAGKLELAPRNATIADMLKSVASTYAQLASEKDIQFKIDIDPALGRVHIFDTLRVSQILNNFTSNALKFTERGTIEISAHRAAVHDTQEQVRFSVKDTGIGIAPEQQQRLFQHYEQASAETARMYGGTGLGLAICQRLAELMDATLSVDSKPGSGSTFSLIVNLPVADLAAQEHFRQLAGQNGSQETAADIRPLSTAGQRIRILVVDDHPLNRMLLKQQLGMLGVEVEVAESGTPALVLWQSSHFDLIISDCHMPEMDGYELTYRVRGLEQQAGTPRIPIIAWTANVLAEEEERCHAAGMDDLLTKPTELAELRRMVLKWLAKAGVLPSSE